MANSPNLALPYLDAAQAQKHVTHNAALTVLDALAQIQAQSNALAAPPGSPSDGQCWIVAAGATGAWAGKDLQIAAWQGGLWNFYPPQKGYIAYVDSLGGTLMWNGSTWASIISSITLLGNLVALGIGTAADPSNPLSGVLNNALFAALGTGSGGTGDLRFKLNKSSSGNTVSQLYQDAFSGRAETGLCGDDNFHIKVSADGSSWHDGVIVDKSTGAVTLGNGRTAVADANYAALPTDREIAYSSLTGARVVTLPAASAYPAGAPSALVIADESGSCSPTNTITVNRSGSDMINGGTGAVIASAYGYLALAGDGSGKWTVIDAPAASQSQGFALRGGQLVASVASNNLTVAVKTVTGVDPTPANPVTVVFRDAAPSGGNQNAVNITAATSFTVNSGNTLGTANNTPFRLWVVAFNDAGTARLGLIGCVNWTTTPVQIFPLVESTLQSSTGGNGGNSAGVFYTGTAVASKPFRIIGYLEWASGLATAGVWSSGPTTVHLFGPGGKKPGDVVQQVYATTSTTTTTTGTALVASSLSGSITPTSAANLIEVEGSVTVSPVDANIYLDLTLRRGSGGPNFGNRALIELGLTAPSFSMPLFGLDAPGTTSAVAYGPYFAAGTAGHTVYCPISTAAPPYGVLRIKEIMA